MYIYKIVNTVNNKVYIGQTSDQQGKSARKRKHFCTLRKGTHQNPYLQFSFNKYGEKSFYYEIIDTAHSHEELNKKEEYWISYYNSLDRQFGYNLRSGGKQNLISEETRVRMKTAQNSTKLLQIRSQTHKGIPKSNEHRNKIKMSNLVSKNKKQIKVFNKEHVLVYVFTTMQECVNTTGISETSIYRSLKTGQPNKQGLYFRYENDLRDFTKFKYGFEKPVIQYDKDLKFLREYASIKEAADVLGLQKSAICNCCKGKLKTTGNYIFKYKI